jgi:hypothetical protein
MQARLSVDQVAGRLVSLNFSDRSTVFGSTLWSNFPELVKRSSVLVPKFGRPMSDWISYLLKPARLTVKTRELIKLALAIGAKLEGAAHSHTRRAMLCAVGMGMTPKVEGVSAPILC